VKFFIIGSPKYTGEVTTTNKK